MEGDTIAPEPTSDDHAPTPPEWGPERSRTVTWHDPLLTARATADLSGIDFLRAIQRGALAPPPILALIAARLVSVEPGHVVFECTPDESVYNPIGVIHGGLVCTLLDSAIGCAVHTTLAPGVAYTSIEIKVNYVRPVHLGLPLTVHGWVVKSGRRIAFGEADVRDGEGTIVATAASTCLVMSA